MFFFCLFCFVVTLPFKKEFFSVANSYKVLYSRTKWLGHICE